MSATDTSTVIDLHGPARPLRPVRGGYGLQPGATPLLAELAAHLQAILLRCPTHAAGPAAKAALRGYVCDPALLATEHRQGAPDTYRRHLLYADPAGSLTLLAIVWLPGQMTPIHGHTTWGAVGVCEGRPSCENFTARTGTDGVIRLQSELKLRLQPGDLAAVRPGIGDLHRIGNETHSRAVTLHAYGRDLLAQPRSLNIVFGH